MYVTVLLTVLNVVKVVFRVTETVDVPVSVTVVVV